MGPYVEGQHIQRMDAGEKPDWRELRMILSDWYNLGNLHELSQEDALCYLKQYLVSLNLFLPGIPNADEYFIPFDSTQPWTAMARPIPEPTRDDTRKPQEQNISRKRLAFLVANTYTEKPLILTPLPGTETSMREMKTALERKGFVSRELLNETVETLAETLTEWVKESKDAEAIVFYFCGHGDYCEYEEISGAATVSEDRKSLSFSEDTGTISIGGDFILDKNNQKMF